MDFTHAVIGGGVVGLAVARQLQGREGASTVLIERHGSVGTETSSRNSEVTLPILWGLPCVSDWLPDTSSRNKCRGSRLDFEKYPNHALLTPV